MNNPTAQTESPGAILEMVEVAVPSQAQPSRVVLERVNWRVAPGDYWVVCGLHRSGKTDLMAVAAGVLPPLRGTCRLFGREVSRGTRTGLAGQRLLVGLVFDGGQLLHDLTLAENVALPLCYHQNLGWDTALKKVGPLLEMTELGPIKDAYPGNVGRNWRQRADLTRAIALEPELLLVDNPLGGLDPQEARWWLQTLGELAAGHPQFGGRKTTLVVTDTSLGSWTGRADQFAVLRDGQMTVLQGRPGQAGPDPSWLDPLMPSDPATH